MAMNKLPKELYPPYNNVGNYKEKMNRYRRYRLAQHSNHLGKMLRFFVAVGLTVGLLYGIYSNLYG